MAVKNAEKLDLRVIRTETRARAVVSAADTGTVLKGWEVRWRDGLTGQVVASAHVDSKGVATATLPAGAGTSLAAEVVDPSGVPHLTTEAVAADKDEHVWHLTLPPLADDRLGMRPRVRMGALSLDAEELRAAGPELAVALAEHLVGRGRRDQHQQLRKVVRGPLPREVAERSRCGTEVLLGIEDLIRTQRWPREARLEVERVLGLFGYGYTAATYDSPNFHITYYVDGPAAVDTSSGSAQVVDPGTTDVLTTIPAGTDPTYIRRIAFWLERALTRYTTPPFSLRNPAAGGRIPVFINTDPYGSATSGAFYLNHALADDLIAAVTVHELFHMVQFQYAFSGPWASSMVEGGAVWAEDTTTTLMNRYLDEAGTNFNGTGVQANPGLSLESASYKCSLFWRYVSEQMSAIPPTSDEPLPLPIDDVGVDFYRPVIEQFESGGASASSLTTVLRALPWYQDFYEFSYLDPGRQDLLSSETVLGNYALACYLKDLDEAAPDRRFDFMEGQELITIDQVIPETPQPGHKLPSVHLAGTGTVTTTANAAFSGALSRFSSAYHSISVDPAVTSVRIDVGSTGITSGLVQLVVIDDAGQVREIFRRDTPTYSKTIANLRAGHRIDRVVAVVTCADSSGSFTIQGSAVAAFPDVMVTRWHTQLTREYEIDSRGWAWTWVSPDVWVDNDGDGLADGTVYLNQDNALHVRLHNKGLADASGISVQLFYQDASGGLSPSAWLPVQDTAGTTQVLSGLSLAAGASNDWSVPWCPRPSGSSHHFCVRVVLSVPGDPNTDNKHCQSNFGNVVVPFGRFVDLALLRRNLLDRPQEVELQVVPRLGEAFQLSHADIAAQAVVRLEPGAHVEDRIRLYHQPVVEGAEVVAGRARTRTAEPAPCSNGVDPLTLPPGLDRLPLVTVTHRVGGVPQGGVTFAVEVGGRANGGKRKKG